MERYQKLIDDLKQYDIDGNVPLIQADIDAIDINLKAYKLISHSYDHYISSAHHVIAHHDIYDEYDREEWKKSELPPGAKLAGDFYKVPIPQESAAQIIFDRLFYLSRWLKPSNNRITEELLDAWCNYLIQKKAILSVPDEFDETSIHDSISELNRKLNEKRDRIQLRIAGFQKELSYRKKLRAVINIGNVNRTAIGRHALDWALHPNRENLRKRDYARMMDEVSQLK